MAKTLCTPEMTLEIVGGIIAGLTNKDAAVAAGITEASFYNWIARGEAEIERINDNGRRKMRKREAPFVEFFESVKKAKSQRKRTLLARIQQAARGGEQYTETKRVMRRRGNVLVVVEETTATKTRAAEWTAAAWLLERLHPDEFGRRSRLDVYDWRTEARKAGYDPDAILENLVAEFEAAMVGDGGGGGPADGAAEGEPDE